MQILKNKTKISAITFVLVLTFSAILAALPNVTAHEPAWEIPTWTYVSVSPNPIGVGQEALIAFWINAIPPTAEGATGDRWTFWVDVTKPDGTKQTLGPFKSDPVGGSYTLYTFTDVGTHTVTARMDEHKVTGLPLPKDKNINTIRGAAYVNDTYLGSTSDPVSVTVQQEPIQPYQETPLPTQFWTRPISGINRNWAEIAGNWLGGAAQTNGPTTNYGYGAAPESAHIMWTTPYWAGGLMDSRFGDLAYYTGMSYEDFHDFSSLLILNGKVYYNIVNQPRAGWNCLNLYTGEIEYFHNTTGPATDVTSTGNFDQSGGLPVGKLSFAQIYDYESPNQHGGLPYLWSVDGPTPNTWMMFDGFSGNYICSIANVSSSGTAVYGKDGSILRYRINNGRLTVWNTSRAIWYEPSWSSNEYWMWRPDYNTTYDGNNGFSLNVSVPDVQGSIREIREGEFMIGGVSGQNDDRGVEQGHLWCLSLKPGEEGTLLWNITFTPPKSTASDPSIVNAGGISGPTVDSYDGVFLFEERLTRQRWGYSLETGQKLWGPTEPEDQWMFYGMNDVIYQGKLFSFYYGGMLTAYDIKTGDIVWKYSAGTLGFETPYSGAELDLGGVADGKLYFYSTEHSATTPLWRGQYIRCINASDGEELWKIHNWAGRNFAVSDGYIVTLNHYDMQLYCYGKGPSATTVTGPDTVIPLGTSVMIKGTVTDQTPSSEAKGTPAIADEYQPAWMEYLYMQRPRPTDAKGVTVKLTAIDPNGNYQDIGEAVTDIDGNFGKMWQPPVPGEYHITATFEGSESYWSSHATTYFGVAEAPSAATPIEPEPTTPAPTTTEPTTPEPTTPEPTTPEPTEPEPTEPAEAPFITTEIAILAVVAVACVIGVVSFWKLRKRK